jgi:hypothetical protein
VKSAYRCMGLSGISQAGALRELSFSISASRVKLLPPEAEHRTSFVICRLDLCVSRDPRWGSKSAKALLLFHPANWADIVDYSCTTTSPPAMVAGAL